MSTPFYDLASLVVVPSGVKAGKVYAQKPMTTDGQITFSRASTATRVNSAGLIETVASNVPRLDYQGATCGPRLNLEPQRTNLVPHSESFGAISWVKLGAGTASAPIVTENYAVSPEGVQNASRIQCDLNGGTTISDQSIIYTTISGSGDTSAFVYAKSNTGSNQTFYLANALADRISAVATTEWQKFPLNWIASGNARSLSIGSRGTTGSDDTLDLLIWGAQVEAGSYATSYIPTLGAAVTRGADNNVQVNPSTLVGATTGSWFMDVADYEFELKGTTLATSWIGDSESNFIGFLARTAGYNGLIFAKRESGTATIIHQTASKTLKVCFTWSGSNLKLFVNGAKVYDNNSFANFAAWDTFQLNYASREASYKLNQTLLFPTQLSDADCIALTA